MSKMVIFNCPAYKGFTRDIPDWLDNTNCGQYTGQVSCADCTDCVMKQIYEMCKSQKESSCVFAVAFLADRILQLLDIQEVE